VLFEIAHITGCAVQYSNIKRAICNTVYPSLRILRPNRCVMLTYIKLSKLLGPILTLQDKPIAIYVFTGAIRQVFLLGITLNIGYTMMSRTTVDYNKHLN
jgi:hypothetical protein